jgi:hypothetical protein
VKSLLAAAPSFDPTNFGSGANNSTSALSNSSSGHYENEIVKFTLECFVYKFTTDYKFSALSVLFASIISADVLANLVVLSSIVCERRRLRKRVDLCFMSNAIADLLMGNRHELLISIRFSFPSFKISEPTEKSDQKFAHLQGFLVKNGLPS